MDPPPLQKGLSHVSNGPAIPEHLFAPNTPRDLISATSKLLASSTAPWWLTHSPPGLQRAFKFKTFSTAMKFMNAVATECKVQKHHPEWGNVYNEVVIRWTTHRPRGITSKDVYMAQWCDRCAEEHGEVREAKSVGESVRIDDVQSSEVSSGPPRSSIESPSEMNVQNLSKCSRSDVSTSEISYPKMPQSASSKESDLLTSLLGPEERHCFSCHTEKKKSKATGTESGPGNMR
ncbi:pterin 4 alpha carbinolamine dehydratase-domain-containing protein [Kalaharituber pfeilii]|nr:pterin 4 alpha carbinolamine dehydratase-domain-containing protein [Kalaharituber pfeilii]